MHTRNILIHRKVVTCTMEKFKDVLNKVQQDGYHVTYRGPIIVDHKIKRNWHGEDYKIICEREVIHALGYDNKSVKE